MRTCVCLGILLLSAGLDLHGEAVLTPSHPTSVTGATHYLNRSGVIVTTANSRVITSATNNAPRLPGAVGLADTQVDLIDRTTSCPLTDSGFAAWSSYNGNPANTGTSPWSLGTAFTVTPGQTLSSRPPSSCLTFLPPVVYGAGLLASNFFSQDPDGFNARSSSRGDAFVRIPTSTSDHFNQFGGAPQLPVISLFRATPANLTAGQSSVLEGSVTNASSVSIDQNIGTVAVSGSGTDSPAVTTTDPLAATSPFGAHTTQAVTKTVNPAAGGTAPQISAGGVVDAASFRPILSPGGLISIFGSGFANGIAEAESLPLPRTLNGVTVRMNGIAAPLIFISDSQINCQIPVEIQEGVMSVTVQNGSQTSAAQNVVISPVSPGVIADVAGHGVIQNQDFSLNSADRRARPGDVVTVYATGLGRTSPPLTTGASSPPGPNFATPANRVDFTMGGVNAEILFAGAIPPFVGLFQLNVIVPANAPSGETDGVLTVGGVAAKAVKLSVAGNTAAQRNVTLRLTNDLIYPVTFSANGTAVATVGASSSLDRTITVGASLSVSFEMERPTLGGRPLGDPVAGGFNTVNDPTGSIPFRAQAQFTDALFFAPRVTNQTGTDLLLGVNMGLNSESRCNCTVPANQRNTVFGYYRYFTNSNVRGYLPSSNYSGSYEYFGWDPSNPAGVITGVDTNSGIVNLTFTRAPQGSGGGTVPPPASTYFVDYTGTLQVNGWYVQGFTLSKTTTLVFRVASDYGMQAGIFAPDQLNAFQNNQKFTGYGVFDRTFGTNFVTLPAGNWYVGARNASNIANPMRYELDYDVSFPGLSRIDGQTYAQSVAPNGGKYYQGFTIQQGFRYWVDGCNSGMDVFLIPESELANFLSPTAAFRYYADYSGINSQDLPGGYEVSLPPGNYYFAFRNTASNSKTFTFTIERWR